MAIVITKEDIQSARAYMPLALKAEIASQIAAWCVQPTEIKDENGDALPPIWQENRALRQLFVLGVFGRFYLRKDFATQSIKLTKDGKPVGMQDVDYYMDVDAYDEWAESHVLNQIERLKLDKRDKEISDKCYDILYDFKAFEAMTYGAIKDEIEEKNDLVKRAAEYIEVRLSKEYAEGKIAELETLAAELESRKKTGQSPHT